MLDIRGRSRKDRKSHGNGKLWRFFIHNIRQEQTTDGFKLSGGISVHISQNRTEEADQVLFQLSKSTAGKRLAGVKITCPLRAKEVPLSPGA